MLIKLILTNYTKPLSIAALQPWKSKQPLSKKSLSNNLLSNNFLTKKVTFNDSLFKLWLKRQQYYSWCHNVISSSDVSLIIPCLLSIMRIIEIFSWWGIFIRTVIYFHYDETKGPPRSSVSQHDCNKVFWFRTLFATQQGLSCRSRWLFAW